MPCPEELLHRVGQAKFISTIDMTKGYFQVPMSTQDPEKTAFLSPFGKYHFKQMHFVLKNMPSTFHRQDLTDLWQRTLTTSQCFQKQWEEPFVHLNEVF